MTRSRTGDRLPAAIHAEAEEIIRLTDGFCAEHLDAEYAQLCRRLVGKLARKRPSPLVRGDLRIWAASTIYAIGKVNFLFDRTQRPHLGLDQLSQLTGVPKSTLGAKGKVIRDLLHIWPLEPEYCRRELLANNPLACPARSRTRHGAEGSSPTLAPTGSSHPGKTPAAPQTDKT